MQSSKGRCTLVFLLSSSRDAADMGQEGSPSCTMEVVGEADGFA